MMAVEALLDPPPRGYEAQQHIDDLIALTSKCPSLSDADRHSLRSALGWLRQESIVQTGRLLARKRLGNRHYAGERPEAFFNACYELRSQIVHGRSRPSLKEVGAKAAVLESFVSNLLAYDLLALEA